MHSLYHPVETAVRKIELERKIKKKKRKKQTNCGLGGVTLTNQFYKWLGQSGSLAPPATTER